MKINEDTRGNVEKYLTAFCNEVYDNIEEYGISIWRNFAIPHSFNRYTGNNNEHYLSFDFKIIVYTKDSDVEESDRWVFVGAVKDWAEEYFLKHTTYPVKDYKLDNNIEVKCTSVRDYDIQGNSCMVFYINVCAKEIRPDLPVWGDTIEDVANGLGQFKPVTEFYDEQFVGKKYITKVRLSDTAYARKKLTNTAAFKYWDRFQVLNNITFPNWFHIFATVAEYKPNPDIILVWKGSGNPWYEPKEYQYAVYLMHRADFDKVVAKARSVANTVK